MSDHVPMWVAAMHGHYESQEPWIGDDGKSIPGGHVDRCTCGWEERWQSFPPYSQYPSDEWRDHVLYEIAVKGARNES